MKSLFDQTYQGPRGPHLNNRTVFTMTGKLSEKNVSIHAGQNATGVKSNTSKPRRAK